MQKPLSLKDLFILLFVVFVWGTNFVIMKMGLRDFPPFLFACLRYVFTFLPFCFFISRPNIAIKWLFLGGLGYAGQFGFLFFALNSGMIPGLASLLMQFQVFVTIGLSFLIFNEKLSLKSAFALGIALSGLAIIATHIEGEVTLLGVALTLCATSFWGFGNVFLKMTKQNETQSFSMVSYVVWSSLFAALLLLPFTLLFENPFPALVNASLPAWGAMFWQAIGNSLIGFTLWSMLLVKYPAAQVTPFALLVPIFGMGAAYLYLGEPLPTWKLLAAFCVMLGLAINTFSWQKKA